MEMVPFWVQIRGLPLNLCSEANARRQSIEVGVLLEIDNLDHARGLQWVKINLDHRMLVTKRMRYRLLDRFQLRTATGILL